MNASRQPAAHPSELSTLLLLVSVQLNERTEAVVSRWRERVADPIGGVEELLFELELVAFCAPVVGGLVPNVDAGLGVFGAIEGGGDDGGRFETD